MKLDHGQLQRLYLAGTVPFPLLYPSVGAISTERGELAPSPFGRGADKLLVAVHEEAGPDYATTRVMLAEHLAAIFLFTGEGNQVENFDDGHWLLKPHIDPDTLSEQLEAEILQGDCGARGIVFVPVGRPVLTIHESAQAAGAVRDIQTGHPTYCECGSW